MDRIEDFKNVKHNHWTIRNLLIFDALKFLMYFGAYKLLALPDLGRVGPDSTYSIVDIDRL